MVGAQCRPTTISSTKSAGEPQFKRGARVNRLLFALCMFIAHVLARSADAFSYGRKHVRGHSNAWQQWQLVTILGCSSRARREVASNVVSREKAWKGMEDCRTLVWREGYSNRYAAWHVEAHVYVGRYG